MQASSSLAPWGLGRRILFRFGFVYFLLYIFPFPLGFWGTAWIVEAYHKFWLALVPWVGKHILGIEQPIVFVFTGSGDTTFHYVQLFCIFVLALLITPVWIVAHPQRYEEKLHRWLRCYVRYFLGAVMLTYGIIKLFHMQFSMPAPESLMMSYAESSPMGLLWRFMGVSAGYTIFSGAMETLGGLLLFWRRTTTLGALVIIPVMVNVVLLNFCYDVPVKLFSSHLVLMACFLLLPALGPLMEMLVFHRAPEVPALDTLSFSSPWMNHGRRVIKSLFITFVILSLVLESKARHDRSEERHSLSSLYEVESFVQNGTERPPLLTDKTRWRFMSMWYRGTFYIRWMNDAAQYFRLHLNEEAQTLTLTHPVNPREQYIFTYQKPDPEHLILEGRFRGDLLTIKLKRLEMNELPLLSRGFHWINEYPFYR